MKRIVQHLASCIWISLLAAALSGSIGSAQTPTVSTVAGTGTAGFSGDGGPATQAKLGNALTVTVDNQGNLVIVDGSNSRVRRVSSAGIITTIAGGGGGTGDGGQATASMVFPSSVAFDAAGNMYIAQGLTIRKVNTAGVISTIAGNGSGPGNGDGGPASNATFFFATSIAVDNLGQIYITESVNSRVRKIDANGIITTFAGTGQTGYSGDGGPATAAKLALPQGIGVDSAGNVYFADNATHIRRVDTAGTITTFAGSGATSGGDGGPATSAGMTPAWAAPDSSGNVFICDVGLHRIRKVNSAGIISTYAGGALNTGLGNGDGGPATGAVFSNISSVAVDPAGNVYVADNGADNIRKVSSGAAASPVTVSSGALSFSVNQGAAAPPSQQVVITSPGPPHLYPQRPPRPPAATGCL